MKITKRQLRRIIKEERAKLIAEQQGYRHPDTGEDMLKMLSDIVDELMETDIDLKYLANEIHGLAQDVEEIERQRAVKTGPGGGSRFIDMTDPREL
jgi:hypothetical protein